ETNHANTGNEHYTWIRIAHGGGIFMLAAIVVSRVIFAEFFERLVQLFFARVCVEKHGTNLRAKKMIGARRAKCGELLEFFAGEEIHEWLSTIDGGDKASALVTYFSSQLRKEANE